MKWDWMLVEGISTSIIVCSTIGALNWLKELPDPPAHPETIQQTEAASKNDSTRPKPAADNTPSQNENAGNSSNQAFTNSESQPAIPTQGEGSPPDETNSNPPEDENVTAQENEAEEEDEEEEEEESEEEDETEEEDEDEG